ncbi:MAG: DUF58 domain-containing protein [Gammaproteobacteria bacterium]|nr:DUF58 domain-containing protein [Gammaproteobacteria bacterium]MBU1724772.1 DUF58 domain-containing protein [Gammaproteobacteria bacterium]MBU2005779.1 DUF58 domain-containing protein [Gammaproteobacteria bacterium]
MGSSLPLLTDAELQALEQRAHNAAANPPPHLLEQRQAGEVPSRYRGAGLDYAESRPYQPGDEPRYFDWRVTARTGKPYTKQFREERRPAVFILLDRRSRMRFGTRVRLKAAQAARVAALVAFAALQQGWAVSGMVLETQPHWMPASTDSHAIWEFVRHAAAACPPVSAYAEPSLASILPLLAPQLVRGVHVYLLSDFADLDNACEPHLLQLLQHHPLFAVQVLDAVECALPDAGMLALQGLDGGQPHRINLADAHLRDTFRQQAAALHDGQEQRLRGWGCSYTRLLAEVDAPEHSVPLPHGMGT